MKTVLSTALMLTAFATVVGCGSTPAPVASEKASNAVIQVPKTMPDEGKFKARPQNPSPLPGSRVGGPMVPTGMPR